MRQYILKRLLLIPLTLWGIITVNFAIIQLAPGGPVDYVLAQYRGMNTDAKSQITGTGDIQQSNSVQEGASSSKYVGAQGVPEDLIKALEKQFGFDKPWYYRYGKMIKDYLCFDFGKSYYRDKTIVELIKERLPVSVSLGLWSTLIIYLIAIPLGIKKAQKDGSKFDMITSFMVIIGSAMPVFLLAVFFIVFFAGGIYWQWFPLRGLVSDNWQALSTGAKIADYFWHITLPVITMVIGGFAGLTMLTKNSFLDEINKQYVLTAKAKGASENRILYGHVFRNAMLIIIAGFPSLLIKMLFTGSLLIEVIFSLNGLGLLGYEAITTRDYPVVFGTLYIFALLGLVLKLISDLTYCLVDPRINFD
ncbi:MAG: microcin C ABC transporter permease YejB [Alphaproteobacteria bacterium]|nr:microcin C ABC transporter permease YejB [Alphaproteobacteria bacterium]